MDIATLPGYDRAGQYQSMPCFNPTLRKAGLNHSILVLLNNFRIGLLGFFIGKLGSKHVAALVKGDIEKPSDFHGVGYIPLDTAGAWKALLARELAHANIPIDAEKVFTA